MTMDQQTAERWVTTSAVIVAAVYAYRRFTEPAAGPTNLKKLAGVGQPAPLGAFATAWGFMFLVLAIVTEISPPLGGSFSILIATGDLLTNTPAITTDIGTKIRKTTAAPAAAKPAMPASSAASVGNIVSTGASAVATGALDPLIPLDTLDPLIIGA